MVTTALAVAFVAAAAGPAPADSFPSTIPLPDGWRPEGIATGVGTSVYAGSLADGSVWKADLRTGAGGVLVEGDDRPAVGMAVDRGLLYVARGPVGDASVYDARTGGAVADVDLTDDASFINDVTVTRDAAYFTNSQADELYQVSLDPRGVPTGEVRTIGLTGDWQQVSGFNANGIVGTPDGRTLIVVNSTTGVLYNVDPTTGEAVAVDTGGELLTLGDGLLLSGKTLYVVRNTANEIVELQMSPDFLSATVVGTRTDPDFDVPTTIATQGSRLYAVNARFGTTPEPDTTYDIVLVDGE